MTSDEQRVLDLVRSAFKGVTLGDGIGLRQANGIDDYENQQTLAALRAEDEKYDWTAISFEDLDRFYCSLSYFDAAGMRFHLPAYLTADLHGILRTADIVYHLAFYDGHPSRFDELNSDQRQAVREFLLLRLSDPDHGYGHPQIEKSLHEFWTAPQP